MLRNLLLTLLVFSLSFPAFAQLPVKKSPTDDPEKFNKDTIAFLRETMVDVNNLRTLENRISFSAELAGLMWFNDEKEARQMYNAAIGDFRELLMQYDGQMNMISDVPDSPYDGGMFMDVTDKMQLTRRFQTAMQVRQQIALSMAEHDGDLAFAFYDDSLSAVTNPVFRQQMEGRDSYFEGQLVNMVAEKDPGKAAKYGTKSLSEGVTNQHIELLRKIYEKDPEKGIEFGAAILSKMRSDKKSKENLYLMNMLLDLGDEILEKTKSGGVKKPVFSQSDMRDLAETFAQELLSRDPKEGISVESFATNIDKYSPGRGAQIRARFKARSSGGPPKSMSYAGNRVSNVRVSSNSNSNAEAYNKELQEREKNEKLLADDIQKIGTNQLSKEDREKIVVQARRIYLQTPGRDKKLLGLSVLAAQVAKAGDKDLASEIMRDAQNLVSPQPKNYQDFLLTWMLAAGYAEADPEKAFPLLEDTISRANEMISAFIKVGEFIDVAGEMVDDGEVQVGAFGGSMIRGMTSELGMADKTLRTLAHADFAKTRALTNRFDRSEVRILAKMMILRAVLGDKKQDASLEKQVNDAMK